MNNNTTDLIKSYQGKNIRIRKDKYVCLTDMAAASGKQSGDWTRLKKTEELKLALANKTGIPVCELIVVCVESDGSSSRWAHPKLSIQFAQWCNPMFALQVSDWIEELMTTGSVSIIPPEPTTPQRQLAPQRDVLDYLNGMIALGIEHDPRLKALITQRMAEELGGRGIASTDKLGAEQEHVIVTVRAGKLGYSQKQISNGSELGKYVKKHHNPVGTAPHGSYPSVNVYLNSPELDSTIVNYFNLQELPEKR